MSSYLQANVTAKCGYCYNGHPYVFSNNAKCIYEIDEIGLLQICRNGKHLENCSSFNCHEFGKFKCPVYYCIPVSYVCDGKVDCPKN